VYIKDELIHRVDIIYVLFRDELFSLEIKTPPARGKISGTASSAEMY
jgi:hypothetical protein